MDKFSVYMPGLETEGSKLAAQRAMHSQYVLQLLQLQRRAGFLCDITVNIEDKSFKAHKPLLAACSLYFRALFADSENAKTSTLNFDKLSASGFEVLLDYIYSGSLAITSENSDQVLYAANCLQMTNVVETCLNFIRSSFKVTAGEERLGKPPDGMDNELQHRIAENYQMLQQLAPTAQASSTQSVRPQVPPVPNKMDTELSKMLPAPLDPAFTHGNQNHTLHHGAHQMYPIPNQGNPEISQAVKALNHDPTGQSSEFLPTPQPLVANPTTEALSMIMPYLVAKNARRPTLNEVRQLLLKNNNSGNKQTENPERFALKQLPPALIPVAGVTENGSAKSEGQRNLNSVKASTSGANQLTASSHAKQHSTAFTISHQKMVISRPSVTVDCSNTNQTTAHTAHTFDVSGAKANSTAMQPFVLLGADNKLDEMYNCHGNDDSSKGGAWSDDRSVGRDRTSDQNTTHLSGTPCAANLTFTRSYSTTSESKLTPSYRNDSPTSYNSSPSIEISPVSSTTSETQTYPNLSPKSKCTRAQSLDFSKSSYNGDCIAQDFSLRPASLSPRILLPGDHSSLISVEQATNAVGALFAGASSVKSKESPSHSSVANTNDDVEEGRLIIDTPNEQKDSDDASKQKLDTFTEKSFSSQNDEDSHQDEFKSQDVESEATGSATVKEEYQSPTSPPPDDSFTYPEVAESTSSATASVDENSLDESADDNYVLDLSIPKSNKDSTKMSQSFIGTKSKNIYQDGKTDDLKTRDALDAMMIMQSSVSPGIASAPQMSFTSPNLIPDENSLTHGLSRKPRRSSGGQTCQWPGCGRLFRHRNIYEEHRKLHEMGVPVTQLRKCYMGARVKKTARERLEEMRMVEGNSASHSNTDDVDSKVTRDRPQNSQAQRASFGRKRNPPQYSKEGPDRKRVTVKDKKEHYMNRNVPWQPNQQQQSQAVIQHSPILGSAPSIALAALQAATSTDAIRQPWPGNQNHETNGIVGIPPHLLNHASNIQGLPTLLSPTSAVPNPNAGAQQAMSSIGVSSNPAVVETLAALGIQIPTKRSVEESTSRSNASGPPIMSSPTPIMSIEHLRRAIALRESPAANYQQTSPTKASRTLSTDGQILANMSQPLQQALASLSNPSLVTGNVTGRNLSPEKNAGQRQPENSNREQSLATTTPATHSYHGASTPWSNV